MKMKDWNRALANTASTRVSIQEYRALRKYCEAQGTTVYQLLREYITGIVEANKPLW